MNIYMYVCMHVNVGAGWAFRDGCVLHHLLRMLAEAHGQVSLVSLVSLVPSLFPCLRVSE